MTITREAYEKHDFIRTSIDLLCAGASWQGGRFVVPRGDTNHTNFPTLIPEFLEQLSKSLLLDGQAFIEVSSAAGKIDIAQIETPKQSTVGTIIPIERVEDDISPEAIPILERFGDNIEICETMRKQLSVNPSAVILHEHALSAIHSALAIPSNLLDQSKYSQLPVEALMMGASQYRFEVSQLRHTLRYGLDEVGIIVAKGLNINDAIWEWNKDWVVDGFCEYGHVYQVFRSKGITLTPIMNSELGGAKKAVEAGLISQSTYAECAQSYGNK